MRGKKIKKTTILIVIVLVLLIARFFFSLSKDYSDLQERRNIAENKVINYMKEKYDMDAKVLSIDFPKGIFCAVDVYNVNDKEKTPIDIELPMDAVQKGNSEGPYGDNYSKVYWEKELIEQLKSKYASFSDLDEVEEIRFRTGYCKTPLKEGVSSIKDKYGVFIPSKPPLEILISFNLNPFSEEVLKELLFMINEISHGDIKIDLFISYKRYVKDRNTGDKVERDNYIQLSFEDLKNINTFNVLKALITKYTILDELVRNNPNFYNLGDEKRVFLFNSEPVTDEVLMELLHVIKNIQGGNQEFDYVVIKDKYYREHKSIEDKEEINHYIKLHYEELKNIDDIKALKEVISLHRSFNDLREIHSSLFNRKYIESLYIINNNNFKGFDLFMDFWDKKSFTDNLLEELLVLIKGIQREELKINLYLGDKYYERTENSALLTKHYIEINYLDFDNIHSIEELREIISKYERE